MHNSGYAVADVERAREFWRAALLAGNPTVIPSWSDCATDGFGELQQPIPAPLRTETASVTKSMGVVARTLWIAVHAKVLGALAGENIVCCGYVVESGQWLPMWIDLKPSSWCDLVVQVARVEAEILSRQSCSVVDLRRELGVDENLLESGFELIQRDTEDVPQRGALRAIFTEAEGALRLRYRKMVLDERAAARCAGYFMSALRLAVSDPNADHTRDSLLPVAETHSQLHDFVGPRRSLPNCVAHQLFEYQAQARPDAVAAVCGEGHITYSVLNAGSNRLARSLMARNIGCEAVVGVVAERNLDWLSAVLAILEAGAVYLPVEPHFPPNRITHMLERAGCRLALLDRAIPPALAQTLGDLDGVKQLYFDVANAEGHSGHNLDIRVLPGQLAYVYFTSGSTGAPKGAMCEHRGMLNHLLAKIEDSQIREDQVVAQTAPQNFDISLWQLLAALLVGGRTLIVEQKCIHDVRLFVQKVVEGQVNILQVVPSYLELMLRHLTGQPETFTALRLVSATGEALKRQLAVRFFERFPLISLLNAYGLTETSDDTNHEMVSPLPDLGAVSVGRPIRNAEVRILDEQQNLAPLGALGEVAFAGVCLGRGYILDPVRTSQRFIPDPHKSGQRQYRSGDYGRWLPSGKLEFLGRRDAQVKINGARVEIGEVENALVRIPGVREGAVIVLEGSGESHHLVCFYTSLQPIPHDLILTHLRGALPGYMVPSVFQWCLSLPLTDNGKVDRKMLKEMALPAKSEPQELVTPTECWLAEVWADVIGVAPPQIGRDAHFFSLGGTSLSALKLAIATKKALSFSEIRTNPRLLDQARLIDSRVKPGVVLDYGPRLKSQAIVVPTAPALG